MEEIKLEKLDDYRYLIPKEGGMRVPGLIFVDEKMLAEVRRDESLKQVRNVAHLPGIVGYSMAMPDMHEGYGFPIGGVAAFDMKTGVISPGGVGYDINCGVRLLTTNLQRGDVADKMRELVDALFINVPSGVGSTSEMRLSPEDERKVFLTGARWAVENGYGTQEDLAHTEEGGCLDGADPSVVSERAIARGRQQLGTVGSGNHFVEVGYVEDIYDETAAEAFGLHQGQVTVFVHCGSRGFGYQVCDDFLFKMGRAAERQGIVLPDRQLACAYINSHEGQEYYSAMACAANYAWANRQMLMHWVRETFMRVLNIGPSDLGMRLLYDVCHNIAKFETHKVDGKDTKLCVHRKGATRAFAPGREEVPNVFREIGQPVLIPGDMKRASYVLVGTEKAMEQTWGSTCHGAGRLMSRTAAKKMSAGRSITREMEDAGIIVRGASRATLVEEIPESYKDVNEVVDIVHNAGISRKVAKLRPMGVIKG